ncbi:excise [Gordonia phage Whitney]|nr:excise [Gordonia phage Whitney]
MNDIEEKELYTLPEAAWKLSTSVSGLRELHRQGKIAFTKAGPRQTRVHISEIRSYASSLETF